ncbi:hypothetical protein DYGSA30_36890 [Dyella sp. GSA-30]|nr:hypothetical protein DYGSA30_36890 [Dyella sp. GSA-30]
MVQVTRRTKHAAPGPYLGFGLQTVRLCYHLITAPGDASVSVEYEDDVSVHYADGSVLLEQTKSALNSEPLANQAVDLWKTLANWTTWDPHPPTRATAIDYHLYVTPVKSGELVVRMSKAATTDTAKEILKEIAGLRTSSTKPPVWQQHLRLFLSAPPKTQEYLVSHFSVTSADADPLTPIRERLAPFVGSDLLEEVCRQIIGYAKTESDTLLRRGLPGTVKVESFRHYLQGFLRKLQSPALFSIAPKPTPLAIQHELQEAPVFVRQLGLIQASDQQLLASVSDYLQTIADKVLWAADGKIFPETLERWEQDLLGLHQSVQTDVTLSHPQLEAQDAGKLVYVRCRQLQASIDTHVATPWFIHGSLHELANDRRLGWHPDYIELL